MKEFRCRGDAPFARRFTRKARQSTCRGDRRRETGTPCPASSRRGYDWNDDAVRWNIATRATKPHVAACGRFIRRESARFAGMLAVVLLRNEPPRQPAVFTPSFPEVIA
ncbi:hypothetical protein GJG85_31300 [Burkholderia sp. MS389]|uniref:hypothetical protein n=1 Tax=Burkholderia sp. MS389 TaxID=2811789 RepID=UPI000F5AB5DE|nr:hypothetical protein [Burkholderia sp. MS389]QRR17903.1 hypothetical protein GJG85_31300 [Burkholderia sp. MS389]